MAVLKQPPRGHEFLMWNYQGLGRALTVKKLRVENLKRKPSVIFLMETRCKSEKIQEIKKKCQMDEMYVVEPIGRSGGLELLWKKEVVINVWYN